MKPSAILLFALLLSACGTARPLPSRDSAKVEVKTVERVVRDTAYFELPVIIEKVATLDTASVPENKYAKSEASVSAGVLHHSLQTKPVREPVEVQTKEIVRDSLVYRDRVQTVTVEVPAKLSWWQTLKMKAGGVFMILLITALIYIILFNNPKLKSL